MSAVLISSVKIATSLLNADAFRILYVSHDMHGNATQSTGLVISPSAPGKNRKVLSWAHGTTGLGDAACPSAKEDPARELETYFQSQSGTEIDYGIPGIQKFIDDGWLVCATDYQGLGTPGVHHYTVNRTNAIDTVTIVHAAREMGLGAGTEFGVIGWSQGGGTAAAAAELDAADYGDLTIVGIAPMSPGVPIVAVKVPSMGAALSGTDVAPDGHMFMNFAGLAAAFPDTLSLDDVYTPLGRKIYEENWNIQPVHHLSDILARAYKHEGQVMAINKERLPAWVQAMALSSATRQKPVCPVFLAADSQHDGTVIPMSWQTGYADAISALGGDITTTLYPNDDHFSLPQSSIDDCRVWLAAKFS
jgi:pimeloyl-ACP methyl ester carboxylesterase